MKVIVVYIVRKKGVEPRGFLIVTIDERNDFLEVLFDKKMIPRVGCKVK